MIAMHSTVTPTRSGTREAPASPGGGPKDAPGPAESPDADWVRGVPGSYLRELAAYWEHDFDWRAQERRLNEVPQLGLGDLIVRVGRLGVQDRLVGGETQLGIWEGERPLVSARSALTGG